MPLSIEHIIAECPDYNNERLTHFNNNNLNLNNIIGESPERKIDLIDLFHFLQSIQIFNKI